MSTAKVKTGTSSLASTAENQLLAQLQHFIQDESKKSVFALGGTIPIHPNIDIADRLASLDVAGSRTEAEPEAESVASVAPAIEPEADLSSPPVVIRWDVPPKQDNKLDPVVSRIQLPPKSRDDTSDLAHLVQSCQPATFGRGQFDIYDESYRKAGKLDSTDFSTNFNPYEIGIIDSIAKMLLPSVLGGPDAKMTCSRGIRAELYKLNIYSSPSGKFKPHVDTPRSPAQFGSLVVCLPGQHEGGQLAIRHHGEECVFDWSTAAPAGEADAVSPSDHAIQWAAFYSDCEHEVLEVTKGHRVTLTYNLYVVSRGIPSGISSMDPEILPICQLVKDMLVQPGFLTKGAILGFNCTHAYAHTNKSRVENGDVHSGLKGVDMAMYVALRAAGLEVHLRPALDNAKDLVYGWREEYMSFEEWDRTWDRKNADRPRWDRKKWESPEDWIDRDGNSIRDPHLNTWIKVTSGRYQKVVKTVTINDTDEEVASRVQILDRYRDFLQSQKATFVGKKLWPFSETDIVIGDDGGTDLSDVLTNWADSESAEKAMKRQRQRQLKAASSADFKGFHKETPQSSRGHAGYVPYDFVDVRWLNEPIHRERAIGYLTYGNEGNNSAVAYSRLAILARVPPFFERNDGGAKPGRHVEWSDIIV